MNPESRRIRTNTTARAWHRWGPYLSERQWGTVREDYSPDGDVWEYTTHDTARSKAYRWGEEGIGGICDDKQFLCFAFAFWNGKDPMIKERLFGLSGYEGNHGEDVKECYYYLDSTPTYSYMKMLYKYPQVEFPYEKLMEENKKRGKTDPEYELYDTGIFNDDKYFDAFIEYAKNNPDDILIKITVHNRGKEDAVLHIIPQLWFRNTWSWENNSTIPKLISTDKHRIDIENDILGSLYFYYEEYPELLFCDNSTNVRRLYGADNPYGYCKDGINNYVVNGDNDGINPGKSGTKAGLNYSFQFEPGGTVTLRFRLSKTKKTGPFDKFDITFLQKKDEADKYYEEMQADIKDEDSKNIQRQAYAGLLWTRQFYNYDVSRWLKGDPGQPPPPQERLKGRNSEWFHLNSGDILSIPDKWEFPWFAAWDLSFCSVAVAPIDCEFAKSQLKLLTREWYMHPNGQLPAYEWNFNDVNPPVHAWATLKVYNIDKQRNKGKGDLDFLESVFLKLLLNFTWWVNRKDAKEHNIFQGGFLGLDNIGVFNRSSALPTGGQLEQADGTSWMAMYSLNMMQISLELAQKDPVYQDTATKFLEHFLYIAGAMTNMGDMGLDLWDPEDEFFYDVLHTPDDKHLQLKIRSIIGLIPLFAVEVIEPDIIKGCPEFAKRMEWFLNYRQDLSNLVSRWHIEGKGDRRLFSLLRGHRMKSLLKRMLDETEFLSDHGIRSVSKIYKDNPYVFNDFGHSFTVNYEPAESESGLFGGNSNWRGPVWFPLNYLIIESLIRFHSYYGDEFKVECPTGSGHYLTLLEIAHELAGRLSRIFLKDKNGNRTVFGDNRKFQTDAHFKDYILFHEYFNGDNGKGLGASHQTGWTGLIADLLKYNNI
jgi:hypothetical protein